MAIACEPELEPGRVLAMAMASIESTDPGRDTLTAGAVAKLFPELAIDGLIGRGGMGAVYRARQQNRSYALKLLDRELCADPAFAERFGREVRALARLEHDSVVTIHDHGHRDGWPFLLTDLVDGSDLRALMRMGPLAPRAALGIAIDVCAALAHAHAAGVVHRDIKPENILVDPDGRVVLADFGLAKVLGDDADGFTLTRTRQAVGTPHYIAPEQLGGGAIDERADLYAVGVVLYELLTGGLPVGHFAHPSTVIGAPRRLDRVILRTLAPAPTARHASASELRDALEGCLAAYRDAERPRWFELALMVATLVTVAFVITADSAVSVRTELPVIAVIMLAAGSTVVTLAARAFAGLRWHPPNARIALWVRLLTAWLPALFITNLAVLANADEPTPATAALVAAALLGCDGLFLNWRYRRHRTRTES